MTNEIVTGDNYVNSHNHQNRVGNWMQTVSGGMFWPLDPRPEEVYIEDIAHALAMTCRFGGHCNVFYSVAEHSYFASKLVPKELALIGLLHDASEAYVTDIPRPVKPYLTNYKAIETKIWEAIAEKFDINPVMPDVIKKVDNALLIAEMQQVMKEPPEDWSVHSDPAPVILKRWTPFQAKEMFLRRFDEIQS